jgi:hypothetical protein
VINTTELVDKIQAEAPRVRLRCEQLGIDSERFIVEGDVGLTDTGVLQYAARRIEIAEATQRVPDTEKQGLLGIERDGKILRWRRGKSLTYTVWRPSFDTDDEYQAVVRGMTAATADWQSICGVTFEHVTVKDTDPHFKRGEVLFPVLRQKGGDSTIAVAFFPDDPVDNRLVNVFDGFFEPDSGFDPVGVLRHELGHALGFRHEHIRPEAPEYFSPESLEHTIEFTKYDPKSVMHYLGRTVGDPKLRFTKLDKQGARKVYGGPDTEFSFAD